KAAMRDSELEPARSLPDKKLLIGGAVAVLAITGLAIWWLLEQGTEDRKQKVEITAAQPILAAVTPPATPQPNADQPASPRPSTAQPGNTPSPTALAGASLAEAKSPESGSAAGKPAKSTPPSGMASGGQTTDWPRLFAQRLDAGKQLLEQGKPAASIQLFYTEQINAERIEKFLAKAEISGNLSNIYLLPAKFGDNDGLRVLYGSYPTVDEARNAIATLPKRYQNAFAPSIHIF
ncbi:MAG: SPOR domain-containing protein, partial [Gallionella sp.]|nr:SPOR domain-containing protein [Gallionella sp.]